MLRLEAVRLSSGEAAKALGVSVSHLLRVPEDLLAFERVGKHRKYSIANLTDYDTKQAGGKK